MEIGTSIEALWREARDLSFGNGGRVERLDPPPTPLQFLRDFVAINKPCIISNAISHWRALANWKDTSYLCETLGYRRVSLHLTPNGKADALTADPRDPTSLCFVSAHVESVPFPEAHLISQSRIDSSSSSCVAYAQQQNDCLRSEYTSLAADCDPHIPWASEALGCRPEAVNLWIGNHLSQTSFHKDHYENLYAVVCGEKHFLLLPPTEVHRLYIRCYPAARYVFSKEKGFEIEVENPTRYVPWCSVNPYPAPDVRDEEISKFPMYFNGPKPFECTVKAGEILYLPSMWFHHVRQSAEGQGYTIAVNYWYDMQFDLRYSYFNFLQSLDYGSAHREACEDSIDENGQENDQKVDPYF